MTQTETTAPKISSASAPNLSVGWGLSPDPLKRRAYVSSLDAGQLHARIRLCLDLHGHQQTPGGDWRAWVLLGGRGAGKTHAGAWWVNTLADGEPKRIALIGPTLNDVREVMIEGPSGVMTLTQQDRRPVWEGGRKRLVWPNGSVAHAFSAEDPDSLRGPQFHMAWADEFCAWRRPEAVLDNIRLALRLGDDPRLLVTTTPRPIAALRRLLAQPGSLKTGAGTQVNAANLSPDFVAHLKDIYGGTRLEAQELEGLIVENDGALFQAEDLVRARGSRPAELETIVVAVDPPASAHGDACGIVVAGRKDGRAYVLADRSQGGLSPLGWARRVVETVEEYGAAGVVAEANQGGEMVSTLLAQAGCRAPIKRVHASAAKAVRAEPVAALYEQGRVVHCAAFPALEEELMALGSGEGGGRGKSPDRADALVWALTHLLPPVPKGPRIRVL